MYQNKKKSKTQSTTLKITTNLLRANEKIVSTVNTLYVLHWQGVTCVSVWLNDSLLKTCALILLVSLPQVFIFYTSFYFAKSITVVLGKIIT